MTATASRATLLRKFCRMLSDTAALAAKDSLSAEASPVADLLSAQILTLLEPEMLGDLSVRKALITTGRPEVIHHLVAQGADPAHLSSLEWKQLLNAAPTDAVCSLIDAGTLRLDGLPVVALGKATRDDLAAYEMMMTYAQERMILSDILSLKRRGLLFSTRTAPLTAAYLKAQVQIAPEYYSRTALSFIGAGDIAPWICLHLAGLDFEQLCVNSRWAAQTSPFLAKLQTWHGKIAFRAQYRDLTHFLSQTKPTWRWSADGR